MIQLNLTNLLQNSFIHYGYFALVIAMMLESMGIPLPSEIIIPLSGFFVAQKIFNFPLAVTFAVIGGLIGSVIAYEIGDKGGRPFIKRFGKYLLISNHDVDLADNLFKKYGEWVVSLSRMVPVVRTYISFPAGFSEMKLSKFMIYTIIGSIPWTIFLVEAGIKLGEHWENISSLISKYQKVVIILIILLIIAFLYTHIKRFKKYS